MKLLNYFFRQNDFFFKQKTPRLKNLTFSAFPLLIFIYAALIVFATTACDKDEDKGIDFTTAHFKKWQKFSGIAEPLWTDPATGKSYPDLAVFEKEVFPCVTDDYAIYYPNGTTVQFHNTERCYAGEPDASPTGTYTFDKNTDSLILNVPFEVPGQPASTLIIRSKVLELTNDKMVLRFVQILPFTNTPHTITSTVKAIP